MSKPAKTPSRAALAIYEITKAIPPGRVMNYGQIGAQCRPPVSGYITGRILGDVPPDVPWWRVVAKDGSLPVAKKDPDAAREQRELLEEEGVGFDAEGRVRMDEFRAEVPGSAQTR